MVSRLLADLLVVLHLGFVLFVVLGGLLSLRWKKTAWFHIPCVAWGVSIEFMGWICPLTPLENILRLRGGEAGYSGGFVEHYVIPLLYPAGLQPGTQFLLGLLVLTVNAVVYGTLYIRYGRG